MMTNRSISIRFDADDGKVDIVTAISVLSDIMTVLDSSVSRAGLWESVDSLAHSAEQIAYGRPVLEARIDSVNDGSVEMLIDLSTVGLIDPQTWFDTVTAFFNLVSPYLLEAAHEAAMEVVKGIAEVSAIGIGEAVIKRRRRYIDAKTKTQTPEAKEGIQEGNTYDDQAAQLEKNIKRDCGQNTTTDEQLLNEFFLDSNMLNAVSRMVKTLDADQHGLNFTIAAEGREAFSYLPLNNAATAACAQDEQNMVAFTNMPAIIIWKSEFASNDETEAINARKATVLYEGGEKKMAVGDMAFTDVDFDVEDLAPGTYLEAKLSGKSIYIPSKGTYHTRDLVIDKIVRKVNG